MPVRITAKRAHFRAGVLHPEEAVAYEAGRFTPKQKLMLKADPLLIVEDLERGKEEGAPPPAPSAADPPAGAPVEGSPAVSTAGTPSEAPAAALPAAAPAQPASAQPAGTKKARK